MFSEYNLDEYETPDVEDCWFSTELVNPVQCREEGRTTKLHPKAAPMGEKTRNDNRMKMLKSISMKQWAAQLKKLEEEMGSESRVVI
jgi:hypothetical protein